jgi:hypothetical protein
MFFMPKRSWLEVKKKILRSGFQMLKTKWPLQFESWTNIVGSDKKVWVSNSPNWSKTGHICSYKKTTSLDRFGMNKIFFITLFFIKQSRLVVFFCTNKYVQFSISFWPPFCSKQVWQNGAKQNEIEKFH